MRITGASLRRQLTAALAAIACLALAAGCFGSAPPAPVGCGTMTATVSGKTSFGSNVSSTARITESAGGSVTVTTAEDASGYALDGKSATGTLTGKATGTRTFTATYNDGEVIVTFTGEIAGPPAPCTGKGTWTMKFVGAEGIAKGDWVVR